MNATHEAETDTDQHIEDLPCAPESAFAARRLVERALVSWGLAGLSDDACLIISELVANAVRHTNADEIRVSVRRITTCGVRLGVADESRVMPHLGTPRLDDPRGRGLPLVDALSERWGTDRHPWGKRVWAELGDDER
ncbi:ATP-binding protein [Streptomyces mirabilis]|uniref:ATP-binding protein n=1 Tax=Streptomyces mirabilis TaxID=68239 RepID=UPI003699873D